MNVRINGCLNSVTFYLSLFHISQLRAGRLNKFNDLGDILTKQRAEVIASII